MDEKFLSVGILPNGKNYVRVKKIYVCVKISVCKKIFLGIPMRRGGGEGVLYFGSEVFVIVLL